MFHLQAPEDGSGAAAVDRKGLTLGQHEVPELLQRIGLAHLVGTFDGNGGATSLQDIHSSLLDMQASQPSAALQVLHGAQALSQRSVHCEIP